MPTHDRTGTEVAIIGMACRFPGAGNVEEFWRNLTEGRESIAVLSPEEMLAAGVDPRMLKHPDYVGAAAVLDGAEQFDASFFNYTPREAEIMDPQQRLFLECAWEALENAGYAAEKYPGSIGVFAGGRLSTYLLSLWSDTDLMASLDPLQVGIGNDIGLLSMLVSYKLGLTGPSYFVQTACSTSLVALHLARQSLLVGECEMALAGAVAIDVPQKKGYLHQRGGILSADGHVRSFDAGATGTVFGNGVGVVVLKRLQPALEDRDRIYAVVRGSATNNDGSAKASFTAPGVEGQAKVVLAALVDAELPADAIGYVEAHGTGTGLGDPIEVRALTRAFRATTAKKGFCALGTVKTNLGHLDAAAGMPGLIKVVLALDRRLLPPSLHYQRPNPEIDFDDSPFFVNTTLRPWASDGAPRRAGLSSFGFGGTNTHLVLEEAPPAGEGSASRPWHLLALSARSEEALEARTRALVEEALEPGRDDLSDICYTLHVGRMDLPHRRILVCRSAQEAARALRGADPLSVLSAHVETARPPVAFLFPGQGAQHPNMGRQLYEEERTFREQVDLCAERLVPHLGFDLRKALYPAECEVEKAAENRVRTAVAQPALFVTEYALARLWMEWGVRPQALLGHSLGEYVAACLAGVFSLEDALALVAARGRLMQEMAPGAMTAVWLTEEELRPLLPGDISLAAVNAPSRCVVAGPSEALTSLEERLIAAGAECQRLRVSHAFHSASMEPALAPFLEQLRRTRLSPPEIPFVSNLTGTWITNESATSPEYWARHLRETVRFAEGVGELLQDPRRILLEVGPGQALSALTREQARRRATAVLPSMRRAEDGRSDLAVLLEALGRLWLEGIPIDGSGLYAHERRRRVPLPAYPFQRERYWLEPRRDARSAAARGPVKLRKNPDLNEWFYVPSWERSPAPTMVEPTEIPAGREPWLVFIDGRGLGGAIVCRLAAAGRRVVTVAPGNAYARDGEGAFTIDPSNAEDYRRLLEDTGLRFRAVVHCWTVADGPSAGTDREIFTEAQRLGYMSLLLLCRALAGRGGQEPLTLLVVSSGLHDVSGEEHCRPEIATLLGPCLVIPQEHQHITCRSVDVVVPAPARLGALADRIVAEAAESTGVVVAYRGHRRLVQAWRRVPLSPERRPARTLRPGGVYLITGGLGNVAFRIGEHLARRAQATLLLLGRSTVPAREEWPAWLASHPERDPTCRRIRRLLALEEAGATVDVLRANVADEQQLRVALNEAERRHGTLHGVIHAAGVLSGRSVYRPLTQIGGEESEDQFEPKAYGLYALERVLEGRKLDFCLLLSSNAAVLGGLGFVAYAAANAFMDAFASDRERSGALPWISSNWDEWPAENTAEGKALQTSMSEFVMTPEESAEAFDRVLTRAETGQIVVSTGDLESRLRLWVARTATRAGAPPVTHARPPLKTRYVEPRGDTEHRIAAMWVELLGLEQVGVFDNFFDLGGHSLLATRLLSRLREAFQVDLPLQRLFEGPTVAQVAAAVLKARLETTSPEQLVVLVSEIAGLSEEEAERSLAASGKEDVV